MKFIIFHQSPTLKVVGSFGWVRFSDPKAWNRKAKLSRITTPVGFTEDANCLVVPKRMQFLAARFFFGGKKHVQSLKFLSPIYRNKVYSVSRHEKESLPRHCTKTNNMINMPLATFCCHGYPWVSFGGMLGTSLLLPLGFASKNLIRAPGGLGSLH